MLNEKEFRCPMQISFLPSVNNGDAMHSPKENAVDDKRNGAGQSFEELFQGEAEIPAKPDLDEKTVMPAACDPEDIETDTKAPTDTQIDADIGNDHTAATNPDDTQLESDELAELTPGPDAELAAKSIEQPELPETNLPRDLAGQESESSLNQSLGLLNRREMGTAAQESETTEVFSSSIVNGRNGVHPEFQPENLSKPRHSDHKDGMSGTEKPAHTGQIALSPKADGSLAVPPNVASDWRTKWLPDPARQSELTPIVAAGNSHQASAFGTSPQVMPDMDNTITKLQFPGGIETEFHRLVAENSSPFPGRSEPDPSSFHIQRSEVAIPRAETMRLAASQAIEIFVREPGKPVEIALRPEELGRVRMMLSTSEAGITVVITSERADTLDLMRRHIDQLSQEFERLGYMNAAFQFNREDDKGAADRSSSDGGSHSGVEIDEPARPTPTTRLALSGLDLRL